MTEHFRIEVESDHLERLSRARPVQAVAELIWNAVDADARNVAVALHRGELGIDAISVRDDGHGIPYLDAPALFRRLGGSWKSSALRSKSAGRMLHGRDGKGRLKALALGRVAEWHVTYGTRDHRREYIISILADDICDVQLSDERPASSEENGVNVRISELHHQLPSFEGDLVVQQLSEIFALYLSDYPSVNITTAGVRLDPTKFIANRVQRDLPQIATDDGSTYSASLEVVQWGKPTDRVLYLCDAKGMPLHPVDTRFHTPGFYFSAYLKSAYIETLREEGVLDLAEMQKPLAVARDTALDAIKEIAIASVATREREVVQQWKEERVYPFEGDPKGAVEAVERQVFEMVAVQVNRHLPDFADAPPKTKAFQLRMLRQAIEKGPEELQLILKEVLDLPVRDQRALAKLLKETSLAAIIGATKLVADRLKFVSALEHLVFQDDLKQVVKERSQLHRVLADNTWIFGEEFALSVDDESLTEVLRKHLSARNTPIAINEPVKRSDGKTGIVDLMLSRSIRSSRGEELDHLIVELKAPRVKIGQKELTQIKSYAFAVANDERFRGVKARWTFWALSSDLDIEAKYEASQSNRPPGCVFQSADPHDMTIWVKAWGQVLAENKARLRFYQEKLELRVDRMGALTDLRERYEHILRELPDIGVTGEHSDADQAEEPEIEVARTN